MVNVRQLEVAGVEDPRRGRNHAAVESGDGDFRLDGRAGRIQAAQCPVEQRFVDGIAQTGIILGTDAGHEQVGVEARFADHRQHFTGFRVDGNDRAAAVAEGLFGRFLQLDVEAEHDVLARHRIGVAQHPHDPALSIGFDLFKADLAVQFGFVKTFDTGLADGLRAAVLRGV